MAGQVLLAMIGEVMVQIGICKISVLFFIE
jgi:hypothetical protein